MMNKLLEWFELRTSQERKILAVLAVLVTALLFYFVVWNPVIGKMSRAKRVLQVERDNLSWMRENVPKIARLKGGGVANADLSRLSNQAALEHEIAMKSYQPKGRNEAQVVFEKVSFNKVLAWLHTMEQKNSLILSKVNITETDEQNIVDARINISKGM